MQYAQYPQYPQQQPQKSGMPGWLIGLLVALVLIIVITCVLAVLAVVGVRKFVSAAKSAEALNGINEISLYAQTSFDADGKLCESASAPVPPSFSMVTGKKWMSSPMDWEVDSAKNAGFSCLKFSESMPQYYQYDYKRTGSPTGAASGDGFIAMARGDIDGNGISSEFSKSGKISGSTLVIDPSITKSNPTE